MRAYRNAALACAALAALSGVSASSARVRIVNLPAPAPSASSADELSAVCPPGRLPDGETCIPFRGLGDEAPELTAKTNAHHDRHGRLQTYDQIPRLPDRPESYAAYRYPIPVDDKALVSGFDLDRPDADQRRGAHLSAVGHGGVDVMAKRGTEVRLCPLEHQEGDAEIVYVGALFGTTVVTRHAVREGGRVRDYLVLHGHLDGAAAALAQGKHLAENELVGYVGDTGSEGVVHLHLEIRRVRDGVDVATLPPGKIAANDRTVAVDPRNLLPLKTP
jgi:murein DD-endopeptidase MepM/ murein hydrolase activator NlpD